MKKSVLALFPAVALVSLLSCAGAPAAGSPWSGSRSAMLQVFPDSQFIAQQGRGATRDMAEANGTAAIAQFFSSEVVSRVAILEQYWEQNGQAQSRTVAESEVFIQSEMRLFGVRHAQDAYFDSKNREWVTVAYINRAEAWQILGPRIRHQGEAFIRLFQAAENESDPFRKALRYIAAQNFSRSPEFLSVQSMGELLYPARMNAEFAAVRPKLASLPQRALNARQNAPVFLDIPVDFEGRVQGAFSQSFAALGFPVTTNRNAAAAVSQITVEEGRQDGNIGILYHPRLQAVLSSPAGALFTFSAEAGRQAAINPDVARRRAYEALAERISNDFYIRTDF